MFKIIFLLLNYNSENNKLIYFTLIINLSFIKDYINI